jgi:hypothetical protein
MGRHVDHQPLQVRDVASQLLDAFAHDVRVLTSLTTTMASSTTATTMNAVYGQRRR